MVSRYDANVTSYQRERGTEVNINKRESVNNFEQNSFNTKDEYIVINPFFFNFLKRSGAINDSVEVMAGVTIQWEEDRKQPIVTIEDFQYNEDAQLFLQMYGDQLLEAA